MRKLASIIYVGGILDAPKVMGCSRLDSGPRATRFPGRWQRNFAEASPSDEEYATEGEWLVWVCIRRNACTQPGIAALLPGNRAAMIPCLRAPLHPDNPVSKVSGNRGSLMMASMSN